MPPIIQLPNEIIKELGIAKVLETYQGAQKFVFICECTSGETIVVKMFRFNFSERDRRETFFYLDNKELHGIPRIISILDIGTDTIVVEEYIDGSVLNKIKNEYVNTPIKVKDLCLSILTQMEPIWKRGVVHRDIKPDNIIIHKDGMPYIIDFGVYKNPLESTITETGFQPHTLLYAAPEQLAGDKKSISYRTDFFSIGLMAYELRYGFLPFGSTEDKIRNMFDSGKLNYILEDDCILNNFFNMVLQIDISSRPGRVEYLLEELA